MKKNKRYIKMGITAFIVILLSLLSYYVIFNLEVVTAVVGKILVILMPIIYGLVTAYLLIPLVNSIEKKLLAPIFFTINIHPKKKNIRLISILITIGIVIGAVYGFFSFVIPQISSSITTIIDQFPTYVDSLTLFITKVLDDYPSITSQINMVINNYSVDIEEIFNKEILPRMDNILNFLLTVSITLSSIVKAILNLLIGFIISIYIISSKELFAAQAKKIVYAFFSVDTSNRFINNLRFANKTFGGFFVGKIVDSIIIGIICYIGTSIIGTPFNVLISVIIGVTNIVPFFGPFLGAIPSLILILLINPLQALYFLAFVIVLQQLDGNIIGPKILGNSTGLSSFWVIFAITLFGGLWGIMGMLLGVPLFAVVFAFFKSLVETKLIENELPNETKKYLRLLYIDTETKELVEFEENAYKPFNHITSIIVKSKKKFNQQKNSVEKEKLEHESTIKDDSNK